MTEKDNHPRISLSLNPNNILQPVSTQNLNNSHSTLKDPMLIRQGGFNPSPPKIEDKHLEANVKDFFKKESDKERFSKEKQIVFERPKSKAKKIHLGRDEKIDADLYYRVRDENDNLKRHQLTLNDEIKRINTALEKVKHGVLLERKLSDRKVIQADGFDVEVETLKIEKEKLEDKVKKMTTIIKGLQSQSVQNAGKSLGRKSLINAKTSLENQSEKNEYLKMINHLRELLKQSDNEVKRLSAELNTPNRAIKSVNEFNKDLRDKTSQVSELQSKYEKTQLQFDTNVKILEHTKKSLEDYICKYNEERRKSMDLENRLHLNESNLAKLPEYVSLIEEYKQKERHLEERIKDLCENPFIKQAEERGNVYRKLQENEVALNEATRRLKNLEDSNKSLEKENKILKEQFQLATLDRDKYKEESMRFKIANEEKEKQSKYFEDQFKMLGQYGEVDSNFTKILNILKLKDDKTSWMKVDFMEKMTSDDKKDPQVLLKEIERLQLEKGMLGTELEKTKSLLQIQQQINEDQIKLAEEDKKILKLQNEKLMKKCEELAKLVDIERLPNKFENRSPHLISSLHDDLMKINNLVPHSQNLMSDTITEFSKDETDTEYAMNENALDLYIGEANFEEGLEKELGFKLANIMTFLSLDFYLHDTETSNLISGKSPIYNLQLSFKVTVDEHFILFLESDCILVDIYYLKDSMQALLGRGKIPLQKVIEQESSLEKGSRVVNGVLPLFLAKDANLLIGSLHYKMRMRLPLLETIKWFKERNALIRTLSPVQDVMMKKVEKELKAVEHMAAKIMSVTILITKAIDLKTSGAPRKIMPYIYYQFYKFDDHFTITGTGKDPLFQDVKKFEVVYDNSFHDYIEKESLQFYVLDNSRPIEVEMKTQDKTNSVNLIEDPEFDDFLGICKVPLRDLIINDLIQNTFPIYNKKNQVSGQLVINIFWESVSQVEEEHAMFAMNNKLPYEAKTWEDKLVIKLGELMRNKGLNLNSAFEIFDRDGKQIISLVNFKDTVLFTFKFTNNQQELEEITNAIFKGRTNINKLDFTKIFAIHLPHEGPLEDVLEKRHAINKRLEETRIVENISINIGPDHNYTKLVQNTHNTHNSHHTHNSHNTLNSSHGSLKNNHQSFRPNETNSLRNNAHNNQYFDNHTSLKNVHPSESLKNVQPNYHLSNIHANPNNSLIQDSNRTMREIVMKELARGLANLGMPVSANELDRIWRDITENNSRVEKFDYKLFKAFYEKYDSKTKSSISGK